MLETEAAEDKAGEQDDGMGQSGPCLKAQSSKCLPLHHGHFLCWNFHFLPISGHRGELDMFSVCALKHLSMCSGVTAAMPFLQEDEDGAHTTDFVRAP